jgi:hypothetical protein
VLRNAGWSLGKFSAQGFESKHKDVRDTWEKKTGQNGGKTKNSAIRQIMLFEGRIVLHSCIEACGKSVAVTNFNAPQDRPIHVALDKYCLSQCIKFINNAEKVIDVRVSELNRGRRRMSKVLFAQKQIKATTNYSDIISSETIKAFQGKPYLFENPCPV